MIRNVGFSPILYGAALLGIAVASGAYVQGTAEMPRYYANTTLSAMPVLPTPSRGIEIITPASGPNGLYRGLSFAESSNTCGSADPMLGCVTPDLLQPPTQNVIVPVD